MRTSQPGAADSSASLWSVPPAKLEDAAAVVAAAVAAKKLQAEPATAAHKRQRTSGPSTPARPLVAAAEGRRAKHKRKRAPAAGRGAAGAGAAAAGAGVRRMQQEQRQSAQQQQAAAVRHHHHRQVAQQQAPAAAAAAVAPGTRAPAAGTARTAGTAGGEQRAAAEPTPAPAAAARAPAPALAATAAAAAAAVARVPQPPGAGGGRAPVPEDPAVPWVAAQLDGPSTGAMQLAQALNRLGAWAGLKPAQVRGGNGFLHRQPHASALDAIYAAASSLCTYQPHPEPDECLHCSSPKQCAAFGKVFVGLSPADRTMWYTMLREAAEQQVGSAPCDGVQSGARSGCVDAVQALMHTRGLGAEQCTQCVAGRVACGERTPTAFHARLVAMLPGRRDGVEAGVRGWRTAGKRCCLSLMPSLVLEASACTALSGSSSSSSSSQRRQPPVVQQVCCALQSKLDVYHASVSRRFQQQ